MSQSFRALLGQPKILNSLRTIGLALAIVVIAAIVQSQRSAFLSAPNMLTLVRSMVALGMVAFAQMLVILLGEIDLAVGAVYTLAGTVTATLWLGGGSLSFSTSLPIALTGGIGISLLAGLVNGFLTVRAGLPSFIVTLGLLNVADGLSLLVSNATTFTPAYNDPIPPAWELAFFHNLGGAQLSYNIPVETLWFVVAFVLFWILRHRTVFGFRLVAIGGNPRAAQIARLPLRQYKYLVFVLCSFMAGLAGLLDFSYVGSIGPTQSSSLSFQVIAAVVIGGASLTGGRGTVIGTLLGVILLALLNNGLALLGVGSFVQLLFIGLVTIGAVWLDLISQRLIHSAGQRAVRSSAGSIT
jgi:ribose/xylose/arabinose/galactoside ABC-type transport system permease subunit